MAQGGHGGDMHRRGLPGHKPALAMRAPRPAARPPQAAVHFVEPDRDAALSGVVLLGRSDPADPLIARERGKVGPKISGPVIRSQRGPQISGQLMDRATRELWRLHVSAVVSVGNLALLSPSGVICKARPFRGVFLPSAHELLCASGRGVFLFSSSGYLEELQYCRYVTSDIFDCLAQY